MTAGMTISLVLIIETAVHHSITAYSAHLDEVVCSVTSEGVRGDVTEGVSPLDTVSRVILPLVPAVPLRLTLTRPPASAPSGLAWTRPTSPECLVSAEVRTIEQSTALVRGGGAQVRCAPV